MAKDFKFSFFVHDFSRSSGHSNALIETVKLFPKGMLKDSKVYCYDKGENIEEEFPDTEFIIYRPYVKFPSFLKIIYFHFRCLLTKFSKDKNEIWISIGTANLWPDIVNIQFITHQWESFYFKLTKLNFLSWCYKKLLFAYLKWNERYVYLKGPYCSVLAPFMKDYLISEFKMDEKFIEVIPSSVSVDRFAPRQVNLSELTSKYPQLEKLNFEKPIFLFVGALERKGFKDALKALESYKETYGEAQFLVIGSGEFTESSLGSQTQVNICHINHTNEIELFFNLADCFIFPTIYEPFGLVIFEAFAAGLDVFVTEDFVGASGLIKDAPDVFMIKNPKDFKIDHEVKKLSLEEKVQRFEARKKYFEKYNWSLTSKRFLSLIELHLQNKTNAQDLLPQ